MDTSYTEVVNMLSSKTAGTKSGAMYAILSRDELQNTMIAIDDLNQRIEALERENTLLSLFGNYGQVTR
ncbi:hypothetical protein [Paenibacillus sp. EPM92]|uniref:hypothetical protein n=1 Tax=Paenibacillus sp. EPM92 TaxID=1561195 RepID=UPI0019161F0B|nr:hypothetical protein [Paenibacillus sp. EPM92]